MPDGYNARKVVLAVIPHFTGALSMLGSGWIALSVLLSPQKMDSTYHRIMLAMSIGDVISAFGYFLSTWPIPVELASNNRVYGAVGNNAMCTAQGFLVQFGITTAFYNVVLSLYYLLVVRYGVTRRVMKKYEPYMLLIPPTFGLCLSIPPLALRAYGATDLWCWLALDWGACVNSGAECDVRQLFSPLWIYYYVPVWCCIIVISSLQLGLYYTVRKIERKTERYQLGSGGATKCRQSQKVAAQALFYVGVFYVVWLPSTVAITITVVWDELHDIFGNFFALYVLVVLFQPAQGFLNFFAFKRKKLRKFLCRTKDGQNGRPATSCLSSTLASCNRVFSFLCRFKKPEGSTKSAREPTESPTAGNSRNSVVTRATLQIDTSAETEQSRAAVVAPSLAVDAVQTAVKYDAAQEDHRITENQTGPTVRIDESNLTSTTAVTSTAEPHQRRNAHSAILLTLTRMWSSGDRRVTARNSVPASGFSTNVESLVDLLAIQAEEWDDTDDEST